MTKSHDEVVEVSRKLKEAYRDEKLYWEQKSRNTWHIYGDRNTEFYHALTKQRRVQNRISGLHNEEGIWTNSELEIENIAVKYFRNLFKSTSPSDFDGFLEEIPASVTMDQNRKLTAVATEKEVRVALFMMHPEKAPGPDGMTALFYQQSWSVIKYDLVNMVNDFLSSGNFDDRLNLTNICLIPKTARPSRMTELRPISLCNVAYKIISKVLCQRLKGLLPNLISETQSAFVSGRLISDNILIAQEMFHGLRTNNACKEKFMAIKTDMSKAYDRVEWSFMERLLPKMGFCSIWVSRVMKCISSVQYKVLLNGQPKGHIVPERGLRQGDPMSPYLFILCTEALIENIKKQERDKKLTGLKVSRGSPAISQLLFADDSLFFCKATLAEFGVIPKLLKDYEAVSGQLINFDKSSLQFGHKVPEPNKNEIKAQLGISTIGGMGSYLGIPESLGGSKIQVFGYVTERIITRRLPKGVTKKITGAISHFWWGGSDPLDPHRSYSPSYGWRSICSARSLVKKRLIKRVGNGQSISVWTDPWLPAPRPRSATPKNISLDLSSSLKVDYFIDRTNFSRNETLLNEYFHSDDVTLIKGLAISRFGRVDTIGWAFTDSGKYTVKSGFKTEAKYPDKVIQELPFDPDINPLLSHTWKLRCPPKLQHFIWQVIKGIIPVANNLRTRGINCDLRCSLCGAEEESINHVFFECPPAIQVWALSKIPSAPGFFPGLSVFSNIDYLFWRLPKDSDFRFFPWILWYIWKNRNSKIYTNRSGDPQEILRKAEVEAVIWADAQLMVPATNQTSHMVSEDRSLEESRVCYIDGAWREQDKFSGQGWFCRMNGSAEKMMGAMSLRRSLSALHAECEALIWAMKCMKILNFSDVVFATDCSQLVKMVLYHLENGQLLLHTWRSSSTDAMSKHLCLHFKFRDRIYCITIKTTVEGINLAMVEEMLYKKLRLDERNVKLALRYKPMVVGCEESKECTICDDDLFGYLLSIDKDNHRSLLLVEETSNSDQLDKLSRMAGSSFGMNHEVLQGNDDKVGPNAITLYVEKGQANQQKEVIHAENGDNTTHDDFMDIHNTAAEMDSSAYIETNMRVTYIEQSPLLKCSQFIEEWGDGLGLFKLKEFPNKRSLQKVVDRVAFGESFRYAIKKSDRKRLVLKCCDESCKWGLRAARIPETEIFSVRRYGGVHTCSGLIKVIAATSRGKALQN
ncbi:uncharacterized protein LOC130498081 [Raphanus sativus]|uniref:Uncharacterized protein LOC130498081 n=1 Tax=Raphanus sativus TaxID=3726 RepID=A0A9W3C7A2_RAPSA|nr:uncharacterized protein LOC130498081 [Raphanus sativus]